MTLKKIIGLMACDPQGCISHHHQLPWHYPEDLAHFHAVSSGNSLIMGRKTFDGLPKKTRESCHCIVFSKQNELDVSSCSLAPSSVTRVHSLKNFLQFIEMTENKTYYMIGGGEIAQLFFQEHLLTEFILTHIKKTYPGDTFLPLMFIIDWPKKLLHETQDFSIIHYTNPRRNY